MHDVRNKVALITLSTLDKTSLNMQKSGQIILFLEYIFIFSAKCGPLKAHVLETIAFCCYNCLDLPWEKFFQVWVTCFPSSWEQENCVEKRLCKFEAEGQEFVTFSTHFSCSRELGKQVTNTGEKLWVRYKSRQL